MLRSGLISISVTDQQLAKTIETEPRSNLLSYAASLIREALTVDPPVATQNQFNFTIDVLDRVSKAGKANDEYVAILVYVVV